MKIYTFCLPAPHWGPTDVCGFALSETGEMLASHISSSKSWSKLDMARPDKVKAFAEYLGGPHEVEWVDDPDSHEGLKRARELNRVGRSQSLDLACEARAAVDAVWGSK